MRSVLALSGFCLIWIALLTTGCHEAVPAAAGPLIQRGYLWQRAWNPAVADAVMEAEKRLDGVVILGAEIVWAGKAPQTVRANINWETLKSLKKPVGLALRIRNSKLFMRGNGNGR